MERDPISSSCQPDSPLPSKIVADGNMLTALLLCFQLALLAEET
jgi:hypothetical protein